MPKIITIVEGEGDILAVPTLLYKILHDLKQWEWHVDRPYKTHNLGTLKKNLSSLLWKASRRKDCGAILILLDLDDGCPKEEAFTLADLIRSLNLALPVAIVFAYAVGAGPDELDLVYERELRVLPTLACALGLWAVETAGELGVYDRLLTPIPPICSSFPPASPRLCCLATG